MATNRNHEAIRAMFTAADIAADKALDNALEAMWSEIGDIDDDGIGALFDEIGSDYPTENPF